MLITELVKFVNYTLKLPIDAEYPAISHTKFILKASSHDAYLENVKIKGKTPDSDTTHAYIKKSSTRDMHDSFLYGVEKARKKLNIKRGIVILDYTYEAFYGDINSNPLWIHEYRPEKGSTGCFMFLCASILIGNKRIFLDSIPVPVLYSSEKLVKEMLERIDKMGIIMELVLLVD